MDPQPRVIGGVVTSVEPIADEAGAEMLRRGGNAADAAVATAFAQGVIDPIYCGIAGGFHGLFHDAKTNRTHVVSAGGRAPKSSRPDQWKLSDQWGAIYSVEGEVNRYGYQSSMVPGFVRGAWESFSRFGSGNVTWQEIIQPSVRLAREGFDVYPYLYRLWLRRTDHMINFLEIGDGPTVLGQTAECARIYLKDGEPYEIGDRLIQEDYARTLERVAERGPDEFYTGETGRMIAEDFARNGGMLSAEDLRDYRADVVEPITGTYHGVEIVTEPVPSVGPVTMESLNILEGWDIPSLGWNTPRYLDRLARAMHLAFRDRQTVLGDPDFVDVPIERLLSKEYAARLRESIEAGTDLDAPVEATQPVPSGTTHTSVMDRVGNAAAITHSLGLSSGVVTPGLGFQHNCHMLMFDPAPGRRNSIAPWKRPITGGGPVLFKRDGQPWLLIGSPAGARKVTALIQAFFSVFHFEKGISEAVSAERIHVEDVPRTVIVEPHFDPETLLGLARLGQHIVYEWYTARLGAVLRDPATGALEGGSDVRGGRGLAVV